MTMSVTENSSIYKIGGEKLKGLPAMINSIENKIRDAPQDISLNGKNIQSAVVEQPSLLAYYDEVAVEAYSIVKYVDALVKKVRADRLKFIKENSQRDYTDTSIQKVIDGDPEYIKMYLIYLEVVEVYDKCKSIVESFKQRSYSLNNMVKIYENEIQNITIRLDND